MAKVDLSKRLLGWLPSHVLAAGLPGRTLRGERGGSFLVSAALHDSALCPSFVAIDARGEQVVIKVFRPEVVAEAAQHQVLTHHRALQETAARGLAPSLRKPVDQGLIEGFGTLDVTLPTMVFTVAAFVEGWSLEDLLATRQLSLQAAIPMLDVAARTAEALSEAGHPHRNLKLSNLLLGRDGTAWVADAMPFHLTSLESAPLLLAPSETELLAAPELFHYAPAPQDRVDVFGFAHLVFRLLTGHCAWALRSPGMDTIATAFRSPMRLSNCLDHRPGDFVDTAVADALEVELRRGLSARESRRSSVLETWDAVRPLLMRAIGPRPPPAPPMAPTTFPAGAVLQRVVEPARGAIRSVSFLQDRRTLIALAEGRLLTAALGREVAYREQLAWQELPSAEVDLAGAHGVLARPSGPPVWSAHRVDYLNWQGKLIRSEPGASETWLSGVLDRGAAFLLGMGTAPPCAVVAELDTASRQVVWASPALVGVARLPDGSLMACGDDGALVLLRDKPERLEWARSGHLRALAADARGTVFVVGSGGHALSIDTRAARPNVKLEAVETTQDLVGLILDDRGTPWAWSRNARLVRRDPTGVWRRVALPQDEEIAGGFFDSGALCVVTSTGATHRLTSQL